MEKQLSQPGAAGHEDHDPYFLNAQKQWNQVYGRVISDKRNWRNISFILTLLLLAAISGIVWQGAQSKVVPYVVVLDENGQELHSGIAGKTIPTDTKIIKKELGSFVKMNRLASKDIQLMRQNVDWMYAHMLPNTSALKKLNAHFRSNNPFELIKKKTRIVDHITSILPVTQNTWAIEWQETLRRAGDATIIETVKYKAIVTILTKNPETQKQRKLNPFGIWILDIEWEKK